MKKILVYLSIVFASLTISASSDINYKEYIEKFNSNYNSSMKIITYSETGKSSGSAFLIKNLNDEYVVTNNHVIENAEVIKAVFKNKDYYLDIVKRFDNADIALLKFVKRPESLKISELCVNNNVYLNQRIYTIANPAGVNTILSKGYISGESRLVDFFGSKYRMNVATLDLMKGGQSGAAIYDAKQNCVISIATGGVKNSNLSFITPISALKDFLLTLN